MSPFITIALPRTPPLALCSLEPWVGASEWGTLTDILYPRRISQLVELSSQKADTALQSFSFYDVKTAAYFLSPQGAVPCPVSSRVSLAR